jgi:hypothetical protein
MIKYKTFEKKNSKFPYPLAVGTLSASVIFILYLYYHHTSDTLDIGILMFICFPNGMAKGTIF